MVLRSSEYRSFKHWTKGSADELDLLADRPQVDDGGVEFRSCLDSGRKHSQNQVPPVPGVQKGLSFKMNERDEQIIKGVSRDIPQIAQPKCPKCNYSPLEFSCNVVKTGAGHVVSIIWCGHCGHTLGVQFVGFDQPQQPMIMRPA